MKIADSDALDSALKQNPDGVANLFSASDGISASLQKEINLYISGNNNIFDSIENGIDQRIDRLDKRIDNENDYLKRKEKNLRDEFTKLNQVISQGQTQFNQVLNFQSRMGF
jgi:flagellar hook-associated protein 2